MSKPKIWPPNLLFTMTMPGPCAAAESEIDKQSRHTTARNRILARDEERRLELACIVGSLDRPPLESTTRYPRLMSAVSYRCQEFVKSFVCRSARSSRN